MRKRTGSKPWVEDGQGDRQSTEQAKLRTEAWIALCAVFSVTAFFSGVLYGEAASQPTVDSKVQQVRALERLVDSLERSEVELLNAR